MILGPALASYDIDSSLIVDSENIMEHKDLDIFSYAKDIMANMEN